MKQFTIVLIFSIFFSFNGFSQAGFMMDANAGCAPLCVNFTDTATNALSWYWDFGDSQTSTMQHPTHCYVIPGMYTVTLIETFVSGVDTATGTVTIYPNPVAAFTYSVSGNTVTFTDQSTNAVLWNWYFGDTTFSSLQNPAHTYAYPGNETVVLMVENSFGCIDTVSVNIIIAGVSEINPVNISWDIYPNPSGGKISITMKDQKQVETLRVENTLGEILFSEEISASKELDLSAFPAGIYFIRVGNSPTKKLILR